MLRPLGTSWLIDTIALMIQNWNFKMSPYSIWCAKNQSNLLFIVTRKNFLYGTKYQDQHPSMDFMRSLWRLRNYLDWGESRVEYSRIDPKLTYFQPALLYPKVFRPEPDREVGPWKPKTGMKTGFLSIKNWIFY